MPLPFDPIDEAARQWDAHGWSDATAGMATITSIMRAHQLVLASVDSVLRPLDLTFARYEVLMLLTFSSRGTLPLSLLGSRLQVHPTSVTSAIDRLERDGHVQREPHPTDRRATLARITPGGRAISKRATKALNDQVFSQLPLEDADMTRLVDVLRTMRRSAGDFA